MHRTILWTSATVVVLLATTLAPAQPQAEERVVASVDSTATQRYATLEKALSGATLVGNFTVTG